MWPKIGDLLTSLHLANDFFLLFFDYMLAQLPPFGIH